MSVRSSTVDDVLARSARRHPDRVALRFAERTWTYRELDDAVSRAAVALRDLGLARGDRVAAYGRNSDAYLLGFLGCARAGLVHVPVNYALTGEELGYLVEQSGSVAALVDPGLRAQYDAAGLAVGTVLALRDEAGSLLERATSGPVPTSVLPSGEPPVVDGDLVQLLYTSGTTSRPKGAMMTHRALVHEYVSCVVALELREGDEPLHPMPLYHSAGMHVFLMPYLAVGAVNHLMEAPDVPEVLRLVEERRLGAVFLAPTVWVPLTNHPDFATRDQPAQGVLRRLDHARPGPGAADRRVAGPDGVELLRAVRDRAAGHRAASRGARRAAELLRAPGALRGGARGRRDRCRRGARRER